MPMKMLISDGSHVRLVIGDQKQQIDSHLLVKLLSLSPFQIPSQEISVDFFFSRERLSMEVLTSLVVFVQVLPGRLLRQLLGGTMAVGLGEFLLIVVVLQEPPRKLLLVLLVLCHEGDHVRLESSSFFESRV